MISYKKFIKIHNLPNKIYDMLIYLNLINDIDNTKQIKSKIKNKLYDFDFIESLAKVFEKEYKKSKSAELKCNLKEMIDELNLSKQYLDEKFKL